MDAGIPPLCKAASVSFAVNKVHLRHNCNVLANLNCNFVIVLSIDINPGHVGLFGITLRGQVLIL